MPLDPPSYASQETREIVRELRRLGELDFERAHTYAQRSAIREADGVISAALARTLRSAAGTDRSIRERLGPHWLVIAAVYIGMMASLAFRPSVSVPDWLLWLLAGTTLLFLGAHWLHGEYVYDRKVRAYTRLIASLGHDEARIIEPSPEHTEAPPFTRGRSTVAR